MEYSYLTEGNRERVPLESLCILNEVGGQVSQQSIPQAS